MVKPYFEQDGVAIFHGDCASVLRTFADESVQTCVTSPPYWGLRDYGVDGQIGLEETPEAYVARLVGVFREVRRVLREDGTLWLNLGDSYAANQMGGGGGSETSTLVGTPNADRVRFVHRPKHGLKTKDLVGIPWAVAFALRADGWYLRSDIIWHKPNPMPESVTDRPTKSHEYLFLLSKSERYYYDAEAIKEPNSPTGIPWGVRATADKMNEDAAQGPHGNGSIHLPMSHEDRVRLATNGRNRRSVWTVNTAPYPGAHFATFPPDLIEPCVKAGSRPGDIVLDPFNGSGTTGAVAQKWGRRYVGVELNAAYIDLSAERFRQRVLFVEGAA